MQQLRQSQEILKQIDPEAYLNQYKEVSPQNPRKNGLMKQNDRKIWTKHIKNQKIARTRNNNFSVSGRKLHTIKQTL